MVATRARIKAKAVQHKDEKPLTNSLIPIAFANDDQHTLEDAVQSLEFDNSDCSNFFPNLLDLENEFSARFEELTPPPLMRQNAFVLPPVKTIKKKKARSSAIDESIGEDELTDFINKLASNSFDAAMQLGA